MRGFEQRNWNIIWIMMVLMMGSVCVHAAILNVPAEYPTIIAAVEAAVSGDEILVQAGVYAEAGTVIFATSNVTLTAVGAVTLNVPSSADRALRVMNNRTGIIINGLTIARPTADSTWRRCAEVSNDASVTFNHCTFQGPGNSVGLILFHSADAVVNSCTFSNFNPGASWAGAIALEGTSGTGYTNLIVENSYFGPGCNRWIAKTPSAVPKIGELTVRNTIFTQATHPMGIYIQGDIPFDPTQGILFEDCVFEGTGLEVAEFHYTNAGGPQFFTMRRCEFKAYDSTRRLMFYALPVPPLFENCLFAGGKHEAVVRIWGGPASAEFRHCTIINDGITGVESSSGNPSSTLIDGWDSGRTFTIRNSLLHSPTSYTPALVCDAGSSATRTYDIAYSIIDHSNIIGQFVELNPGANYSNDSILFVNPAARNYRQQDSSPGVNTGIDLGIATDLDGNPRNVGLAPDMGCYESSFLVVDEWLLY